jgi:hypothetical protein
MPCKSGQNIGTLNQDYSSRDIKKKPKVIRTRIIVLTTMDAFFAMKTYVNEVVLVKKYGSIVWVYVCIVFTLL